MLVGPPGLRDRLAQLMELFFPGSSSVECRFTTEIHEIDAADAAVINGVKVTGYLVEHGFKRSRLHTQIAQRRCCAIAFIHKPVLGDDPVAIENRRLIAAAVKAGFSVNLSADNPVHADRLAELGIAPVVTVLA